MNENRGLWRGKSLDNGEWVRGFYSRVTDNYTPKNVYSITTFKTLDNNEVILTGMYAVDPSTLGECTGLRDKNGKLIFEGDIVKTLETDSNGKQRCFPVVQSHGAFWLYDELLDTKLDFLAGYEKEALEIIGNVFDNPELLESGDVNDTGS